MTFKVVLTVYLALTMGVSLNKFDVKNGSRQDAWGTLFALVVNAVLIYGVWKWL